MSTTDKAVIIQGSQKIPAKQLPDGTLCVFDPAVTVASGTTTANGLVGGTTVVDNTRAEATTHWNGQLIEITSGAWSGQVREIVTWDLPTRTFTVAPAFGGQILAGVTYNVLAALAADIETAAIQANLGTVADVEAEAGSALARLLWIKNGVRRGTGTILPVNTSLYDWILTRAAPGDAMALTPAERLIVQALIINDITPFPGARIDAAISSRAAPGAQMALTAAERLIVQALVINDLTPFPGADVPLIRAQTDKIPAVEHETEWASMPISENVASANLTDLTAGSIVATFPVGSTRVRAILVASIHAANQSAATHHVGFVVQGQKNVGGYGALLTLTAVPPLSMVNLDGASDGWCAAIDVTALVDASGSTYTFRFQVDSNNAGSVNYTTSFTLVLVYTM